MSTAVSASQRPPATAPIPALRIDDAANRARREADRVSNFPAAARPTASGSSSPTALAYPTPSSTTFAPVRRAVAIGLLTLGVLLMAVSASIAQPVTTPTTTGPASTTSTSTTARVAQSGGRLPTLGEGFPWITVGAVVLVAGLVGARLRRASRS